MQALWAMELYTSMAITFPRSEHDLLSFGVGLKQSVYTNNPYDLDALQLEIKNAIPEIMGGKLQHVIKFVM
jgi:hypothetical protein